jgi:hypothetical protein
VHIVTAASPPAPPATFEARASPPVQRNRIEAAIGAVSEVKGTIMSKETTKNQPAYIVFGVQERDRGQKAIWTRVGVVFKHREGEGLNQTLQALPINFDGRLVLMPPKGDDETSAGDA